MKRQLIEILGLMLLLLMGPVRADVTGTWDVAGMETINLPGLAREKVFVREQFTFGADGVFKTSEGVWANAWGQRGKRFSVTLDAAAMERYVNNALGPYARYATLHFKSVSLRGQERKGGTKINGILRLKGSLHIEANGRVIDTSLSMRYEFSGRRAVVDEAPPVDDVIHDEFAQAASRAPAARPVFPEPLLKAFTRDLIEAAGLDAVAR